VGCHLGVYSREVGGRPGEKICVVVRIGVMVARSSEFKLVPRLIE